MPTPPPHNPEPADEEDDLSPAEDPGKRIKTPRRRERVGRGSAKAIEVANRKKEALQLRLAGATYQEINDHFKMASKASGRRLVLSAVRDIYLEEAYEFRSLQNERYQKLHKMWWLHAFDPKRSFAERGVATDRCLRILRDQRELLGLDDICTAERMIETAVQALVEAFGPDAEAMQAAAATLAKSTDEAELRLARVLNAWMKRARNARRGDDDTIPAPPAGPAVSDAPVTDREPAEALADLLDDAKPLAEPPESSPADGGA